MAISLDTETTGVDFAHGAKPFLVTIAYEDGTVQWWEWEVDPETREPKIDKQDLREILQALEGQELILQNAKFDVAALEAISPGIGSNWPWNKTNDLLYASHILASNRPKDLTSLARDWIGVDIQPYEDRMARAVVEARNYCRRNFPSWRIAKKGLEDMPSAKEKTWKLDSWLPKVLARYLDYEEDHEWHTVTKDYANADSRVTLLLWAVLKKEMESRGLWKLYQEQCRLYQVIWDMEHYGVTMNLSTSRKLKKEYLKKTSILEVEMESMARALKYDLSLPRSGNNQSLTKFCFEVLKLPCIKKTTTGKTSLDKETLDQYCSFLEGESLKFIQALRVKRKLDTSLAYLESYMDYAIPIAKNSCWARIRPNLNATGSDTLRCTSNNPNGQNIAKQRDASGLTLRSIFGPLPGREWWSLDYENIELRIPAYEAEEEEMIQLFERPNDPPYYGSQHLLFFDILHPDKFAKYGKDVKVVYKDTWYQWTKNGDFAVQYGAVAESGTADRAYHVEGAQHKIESRLSRIKQLSQRMISFANRHGYVETMPDKTVDPNRGYPLLCSRNEWGKVKPTIPLSYHVQGTAMWCTRKAMVRCHEYLRSLPGNCRIVLQVHDEMVFDLPFRENRGNQPIVDNLKRLMELSGEDIGVPLKVSATYHPLNWGEEG